MSDVHKRLFRWLILAAVCVLVLAAAFGLWRVHRDTTDPEAQARDNHLLRVRPVVTIQVPAAEEFETSVFTGFARESQTMKISFRVPGPLVEFRPVVGQRVEKGTLLGRVDERDFQLALGRVEAGLAEAGAVLAAMETGAREEDVASLKAQLSAAESQYQTAAKNERRFAALLESQSVAQAKYDEVRMLRDSALAARDAAREQLKKAETGARQEEIDAVKAKIQGLEKEREAALNAIQDTRLLAPCDGYVSQKYTEEGEIVAPGMPVLAFTSSESIHVESAIPEALIVRQGDFCGFECEFEAYPGVLFPATLLELGQALQPGKQGYPITVEVQARDGHNLFPGMSARLLVKLRRENTPCVVPYAALVGEFGERGTATVWTLAQERDGETAQPGWVVKGRKVQILRLLNDGVEIGGELQPGERIVGAGARFLAEGQAVRVF